MDCKNTKLLIVEDEFFASKYLAKILNSFGYSDIFEASNAKDALTIVKENKIDLAFMDINIDGAVDGIECANIINQEYFIPIIFTTAYGDTLTINEAKQSNIFGYLIKPFENQDVGALLSVAFKMIQLHHTAIGNSTISLENDQINLGKNYNYDLSSQTLYLNKKPLELTKKELDTLDFFCKNANQNISYEALKTNVWENANLSNSTIRDTIARLKRKVKNLPLDNIVNIGYILKQ